ncbi:GIP [Symbiodinium microadriaticum]|nr:GIP [Symbiodinium microadriaticum]
MLESSVHCELTAQGHAQRAGSRVREVPREGCHYHLEVARSQPVPADMQVCCLHVEAQGMDQGPCSIISRRFFIDKGTVCFLAKTLSH